MKKMQKQEYIYHPRYRNTVASEQDGQKNIVLELLKQIRPGLEFYRISLPAYLMDSVSFLEKMAESLIPNNLLEG